MLHADDRASGDSLILESGGQLESCHTFIENTGRTLLGDLPMTGHCRAKRDTRWGLQEGAAGKDCTGLAPHVHLTGPCDPEEAMWFSCLAPVAFCYGLQEAGRCLHVCVYSSVGAGGRAWHWWENCRVLQLPHACNTWPFSLGRVSSKGSGMCRS